MQQFPASNIDDYGPRNASELCDVLRERVQAGETLHEVGANDALVGVIGFQQITPRLGLFRGICFDRGVHGSGIPAMAVRQFLHERFGEGTEKIQAFYFASNHRVRAFLKKLGAVDEGYLSRQTLVKGKPADMRLVAFHAKAVSSSSANKEGR